MENELENEELHDIIAHNHVIQWISPRARSIVLRDSGNTLLYQANS